MNPMKYSLLLAFVFLLLSCRQEEKKEPQVFTLDFPGGTNTSLPRLYAQGDRLLLSWVTQEGDSLAHLNYAELSNNQWSSPRPIISGTNWFVNWADFPMILENNGHLLTHYLVKTAEETFAYDIRFNVRQNHATAWKTALPIHKDSSLTEHGFVSGVPYGKDAFLIAWLDGRNMSAGNHHEGEGHSGEMNVRAATVRYDGTVTSETVLDSMVCTCCQTTTAMTDKGPVVLFRDKTDQHIRDIAITRLIDGQWTAPKPIHDDGWEIMGCPVNGPMADARGNNLAVAWYTGAKGTPKVKVVFSKDSGATFGEAISLSGADPLGRVDVVWLDEESALVSWMEPMGNKVFLKAVKVYTAGQLGSQIIIDEMENSRGAGFPQMEQVGDTIYFAWTANTGGKQIKTAYVPAHQFLSEKIQ